MKEKYYNSWELKQLTRFLKEEKLFGLVMNFKTKDKAHLYYIMKNGFSNVYSYSDLVLSLSFVINFGRDFLVMSQLWRFHLYKELLKLEENEKSENLLFPLTNLKARLCSAIKANGDRDNERLKELFKIYMTR